MRVCGGKEGGGRGEEAILGDGGIGNAGEGGGLGTHVVLTCPTYLQVFGVFALLARWRLLSNLCCAVCLCMTQSFRALVRIARKARGNCAARWDRPPWCRNMRALTSKNALVVWRVGCAHFVSGQITVGRGLHRKKSCFQETASNKPHGRRHGSPARGLEGARMARVNVK